jgi:transglutaminase-like putative cysteine protease
LHDDFKVEYRETGQPFSPNKTFKFKRGSCRDLSWLLISLLRNRGIAARFVSGYFYFDMDEPAYELHAWVEVFLPGNGWLGLDPSHGIFTGNSHFPIVSSAHYENTMPVSGGIRGSATSKLKTQLSIEII